jgi:hypothetical protein
MKKKIFIGLAMSLFAVATVFNINIAEKGQAGDVSLDAIAVMAQAWTPEGGTGTCKFDDWMRVCTGKGEGCRYNGTMCR